MWRVRHINHEGKSKRAGEKGLECEVGGGKVVLPEITISLSLLLSHLLEAPADKVGTALLFVHTPSGRVPNHISKLC